MGERKVMMWAVWYENWKCPSIVVADRSDALRRGIGAPVVRVELREVKPKKKGKRRGK
jgi:hypothetical protein